VVSKRSRNGFTLIEVLVSVLLVMLVMLLLVKGMDVVTTAVSGGQRLVELNRQLETARRILEDDIRSMVHGERSSVFLREDVEDQPVFAFLRYRNGSEGEAEREWVQYWVEPHAEEGRLRQWVRYSGAVDSLAFSDPASVDPSTLNREIILDDLVSADLVVYTELESVKTNPFLTESVEAVDIRLAVTTFPYPILNDVPADFLERIDKEDGAWIEFRVRPESSW
jgi:type II secretory pathway component PulJ